ncbi:MAG: insulinase family protein [Phycisphaerales bacterium]|nr:insulinase family protein [Phycisphaerales bacterium]
MIGSVRRVAVGLVAAVSLSGAWGASARPASSDIPARPEKIEFRPLRFEPPKAADFRSVLSTGTPVYMAQSKEVPLVTVIFTFRGGSYLNPKDKLGLASMTGALMRRGGTVSVPAQDLDEKFDFLAAQVNTSIGEASATASINCLKSNFDEAFGLFVDMVRNPGFQSDKTEVYRAEVLEQMKQRNDNADGLLNREWSRLLYGEDHFESAVPTKAMVESITQADMQAFHRRIFHPGNLIIGVVGDFEPADMKARLEKALSGWAAGEKIPLPPAPTHELKPGVYAVEKDIPQGKVYIGMRGLKRGDPDEIAIDVMNDILGGGGFTSRIMNRVRTEGGLAYSAGSRFSFGPYYPGEFRALFQSKSSTVALAAKYVFDEVAAIQSKPVSAEELETAKNQFIDTFPRRFESKRGIVSTFIDDEWTGRPADWWATYRDKVRAVTAEDVQRVAKKHLDPAKMAFLIVGRWDEIAKGDVDGKASMKEFFGGQVTKLPLRDPMTQQPLPAKQ